MGVNFFDLSVMVEIDSLKKTNQTLRLLERGMEMQDEYVKKPSGADRRSRSERREFLFALHIPERRSGLERRNRFDKKYESLLKQYYLDNNNTYH